MNITLIFYKNNKKVQKFELSKDRITVGRDANCDIVINDSMVSGLHFEIFSKDNMVFVKDNNSLNGTFLDGASVVDDTAMGKRGEITFCSHKIEFVINSSIKEEANKATEEDNLNKTMISMKVPDLQKQNQIGDLLKSKKVLIGVGVFFVLSLLLILLLPSGSTKKVNKNPFKARTIDTYFIQLDKKISATVTDKASIENATNYFKLGEDKLKLKDLNRDAVYEALMFFIKAKESIVNITPKPELWDSINPKLIKTKNMLKNTIKQLYADAWVAEKRGDKEKAKEIYGYVLDTIPDPDSRIYKNTEIRINRLQ